VLDVERKEIVVRKSQTEKQQLTANAIESFPFCVVIKTSVADGSV
jgi:hypothetical protein